MAEEGRGNAIPPQRLPLSRDNLLRVLTRLRLVQNVKKAIAWSFRAEPSFGFHQNSPVKNFRTAKIFSSSPIFCQQKFFAFQAKNLGKKVFALHARKRAKSVGRYQPMSLLTRFFRTAKKSWSADCQLPNIKKRKFPIKKPWLLTKRIKKDII